MDNNYSDYIVYVDESGDHGLIKIDPEHPVFTLVFCIFKKSDYADTVKNIIDLKFKYFSSDMVVLHEMDIRRRKGVFKGFSKALQNNLNNDLAQIVENNDFTLIATVIKKQELLNKYKEAGNPYHIATGYCLERLYHFLKGNNNHEKQIDVVVESRGKNEDEELELEFRRWCDGDNYFKKSVNNFNINIVSKKVNSAGLKIADLVARPIGLSVLRPNQENRAFEIIKNKFRKYNNEYKKYGLKIFP